MREDFILFPALFNNLMIERLMDIAQTVEWERGIINEYSNSQRAKVSTCHPGLNEIMPVIEWEMRRANMRFGFDVVHCPYIQFAKYDPNLGNLGWHFDTLDDQNNLDERKISMTVQLSDPSEYDGGDLQFRLRFDRPGPDSIELRQKGSVIFFPSYTQHCVTQVTKGTRYSLAGWFHGPYWR